MANKPPQIDEMVESRASRCFRLASDDIEFVFVIRTFILQQDKSLLEYIIFPDYLGIALMNIPSSMYPVAK
jgi:hypothetical protein